MREQGGQISSSSYPLAQLSPEKRAKLLDRLQGRMATVVHRNVITRNRLDGPVAVSFAQQRLWFLDQLAPGSPTYNIPYFLRLRGRLQVPAMVAALNEIVRRHAVLRTTFDTVDDDPVQVISPHLRISVGVVDLSGLPSTLREARLPRLCSDELKRPFDLRQGPLLRATVLRLAATDHVLLSTIHHIVSDGWSLGVLGRELSTLYTAFTAGRPSPLEELPIQYADFALWQRQWLRGPVLEKQLAYWRRQLAGELPVLELPSDRPRPATSFRGTVLKRPLPIRLMQDLGALSRRHEVTLFMTLLAAYTVLLQRASGQRDIVVGSVSAGRNRAELEPLIGFFVNMLVLRSRLDGDVRTSELLKQIRETTLGAHAHQDLPFEKLVDTLQPDRAISRTPLFQVSFTLQVPLAGSSPFPQFEVSEPRYQTGVSRFDLGFVVENSAAAPKVSVEYSTELFDATTIARMMAHYETLLEALAAAPESRLSALQLMSEAQRAQVLREWNDSGREFVSATIPELFAAQVARTPEGVAATFAGGALSYGELDRRSGALARHLRALGAVPEMLVGLCVERSLEMVVAMVGILKSGAAYLPLDPTYPSQRLAYMLADAQASLLVTQERLLPALPQTAAATVCVDREQRWRTVDGGAAAPPPVPANLAYAIYTSGSTGQPKGVLIAHRSVANFISSVRSIFVLRPGERVLQFASICFDVSVFETFSALLSGATLCLSDRETLLSPELLSALLLDQKVTVTDMPPAMMALLDSRQLAALRIVFVGGEKFSGDLVKSWALPGRRFFNGYGPTESTVTMTLKDCPPGYDQSPPIGVPMPNHEMYVLDRHLNAVPVGAAAELVISGEGLTRGYHRRPRLTAEKLVPHPFTDRPGSRLYRTGDLVRFLVGGDVDFLGRIDDQVKIRGLRIELGEIEQALAEHPAVVQVVVMVREDEAGQKRLVAYLVLESESPPTVSDIRRYLGERLPTYMIPSAFLLLDELPTSPSGKVDRRRLPAPEPARPELDQQFVAPRTVTEKMLAEQVFAPVLGVESVGIDDNFFELGGNSLQATQVISRVRRIFELEVPLRLLFESPTVAGLARNVERLRQESESAGGAGTERTVIARRQTFSPVPVSFAQQRLWFLDQLVPGNPTYNVPYYLRLREHPLGVPAITAALNEVVRRHEVLRTTFDTIDDDPVQVIARDLELPVGVVDLSALPAALREARLSQLCTAEMMRPFDLHRGPLLRVKLLRLAATDHVLMLTMHHVITDAWSAAVMAQELSTLYTAFVAGRPSPLAELPIQYADFAVWQRQWLSGEVLAEQLAYWRQQLDGLPTLELPTDRPRPAAQSFRGAAFRRPLPRPLMQDLKALGRRYEATLFLPLLAAYMVMLQRYSSQHDLVVGSVIAGRNRAELEPLIGFFVNMLVLRARLGGDPPVAELLQQIRKTTLEAHAHQDLPFEKLVDALQPQRDVSRTPLFQVSFTLQSSTADFNPFPEFRLSEAGYEAQVSRFDLGFVADDSERPGISVEYSTDLFDATTIGRMTTDYETLLAALAAAPESRLSELQLMSEAQRAQVLREWNDSGREFVSATIPELFAAQVARTPEGVAATFAGGALSYGELDRRSGALARHLRALGAVPEMLVGLCVERSLEMVVAMVGILKSGAAYLPLDPTYPPQRLTYMLADAQASLLVTQERLLPALPQTAAAVVCVDREQRWRTVDGGAAAPPPVPANLAYAIYTSGSTGQPKGVLIAHRSVANFISSVRSIFVLRPGERVLQFASICFDVSVFETFSALLSGATLCLSDRETLLSPELLSALLLDQKVTVTDMPPAMMALLDSRQLAALRIVFVGGEKFSGDLVKSWALPGRRFFNGYGPTESTVTMTLKDCPPGYDQSPPIGVPMPNHEMYVLDRHLNAVPVGAAAELVISGEGLTRGYHRRPRLTAEKLVPHPFTDRPGSRLYRTGDLVRFLVGGDVDFLGRIDDQVKIRGLRIELGEIEQALAEHPAVVQVVVMVREDQAGQKRLVAYLATESEPPPTVSDIRRYLGARLPAYMIPSAFLLLDELPTSPSGKVDRRRLPAPEPARPELDQEFVAPRTAVEKALVEQAFAPVLGVERVGIHDNFFELGGNSLQATQLISRVRRTFELDVPLRLLFESPTVAGLAQSIEAEQRKKETAADALRLLDEIEQLSEEEVEQLLTAESG